MKTAQPIRLCLFEQYDFGTNDYYISMTFQKTSIDIVYKRKKRLAKSGKDKTACFNTQNNLFRRVEQFVSLGRTLCSIQYKHFVLSYQNILFSYSETKCSPL